MVKRVYIVQDEQGRLTYELGPETTYADAIVLCTLVEHYAFSDWQKRLAEERAAALRAEAEALAQEAR